MERVFLVQFICRLFFLVFLYCYSNSRSRRRRRRRHRPKEENDNSISPHSAAADAEGVDTSGHFYLFKGKYYLVFPLNWHWLTNCSHFFSSIFCVCASRVVTTIPVQKSRTKIDCSFGRAFALPLGYITHVAQQIRPFRIALRWHVQKNNPFSCATFERACLRRSVLVMRQKPFPKPDTIADRLWNICLCCWATEYIFYRCICGLPSQPWHCLAADVYSACNWRAYATSWFEDRRKNLRVATIAVDGGGSERLGRLGIVVAVWRCGRIVCSPFHRDDDRGSYALFYFNSHSRPRGLRHFPFLRSPPFLCSIRESCFSNDGNPPNMYGVLKVMMELLTSLSPSCSTRQCRKPVWPTVTVTFRCSSKSKYGCSP